MNVKNLFAENAHIFREAGYEANSACPGLGSGRSSARLNRCQSYVVFQRSQPGKAFSVVRRSARMAVRSLLDDGHPAISPVQSLKSFGVSLFVHPAPLKVGMQPTANMESVPVVCSLPTRYNSASGSCVLHR